MNKKKAAVAGITAVAAAAALAAAEFKRLKSRDKDLKKAVKLEEADAISAAFKGLGKLFPAGKVPNIEDYVSENFYQGHETFRDTGVRGGKWRLGYARVDITPDDYTEKNYYLGGYLSNPPGVGKSVLDPIYARIICIDDSSGRGSAIFTAIDTVGITSKDVRAIRARLKDFAKENNIVSINISATHAHSSVDTVGIWGELPKIIKNNIKELRAGRPQNTISGKDPAFMEALGEKIEAGVQAAFADMRKGQLLYKTFNDLKYSHDKRKPYVVDENITKLHFIPDDGGRETIAVFMAAHPTALGEKNTEISADYIYYLDEEANKAGSNLIFFQGPQLAVAQDRGSIVPEGAEGRGFQEYGRAIGRYLLAIKPEDETKVEPILNIRHKEIFVPAGNHILMTLMKAKIVESIAVKKGRKAGDMVVVTEVGYVEMGKHLRFALIPGEFAPEMLVGGTLTAAESCVGADWPFPPMKKMLAEGTDLIIIGLCNDLIGYILPDNDYGCFLEEGRYEEAVSIGPQAGSTVVSGFRDILRECCRLVQ